MLRTGMIVLALLAGAAQAGVNSWTYTGPEGGPVASVAFDPADPDIVLVGSARGVHRSENGGTSWSNVFAGDINDVSQIVFDPSNANRVYILGNVLYRSDDRGRTFPNNLGLPNVANVVCFALARDGVLYYLTLEGRVFRSPAGGAEWTERTAGWSPQYWRNTIAVDPGDSNIVYAAIRGAGTYKSSNGGQDWSLLPGSPGSSSATDDVSGIAVDPTDGQRLVAGTASGLRLSPNGGASWSTVIADTYFPWVGFDPVAPASIWALDRFGQIHRSNDRGATWPANLQPPRVAAQLAYSLALNPVQAGSLWMATSEGPMFSGNGAATFSKHIAGIVTGQPVALAAAGDGTIYSALRHPAGVFRRSGAGWTALNNAPLLDPAPGASELRSVSVAAQNSSILYAIDLNRRLMRSNDGGATWQGPHAEFIGRPGGLSLVAADPVDPLVVYAGTDRGLMRSADGGATWQLRTTGLPEYVQVLAISPTNPGVIYASALTTPSTAKLFRSADAGLTWTPTTMLSGTEIRGITVDPAKPDVVYVLLLDALVRSKDGGVSWQTIDFGRPANQAFVGGALVVDPVYPDTLIASSTYPALGFLRSVDGGATWETSIPRPDAVYSAVGVMTLNPQRPGLLTAGVYGAGLAEYEISPDLGVTITGQDQKFAAGGTATVTVTVENFGPHAASAARLAVLPPGFLTASLPVGCSQIGVLIQCDLPAMKVGERRSLEVRMAVAANPTAGFIGAEVTGHEPDAATANNQVFVIAGSEEQANLAVTLSTPAAVTVGGSTSLVATVTNAGPHASPRTLLTIMVPDGLTGQSATSTQGTCATNASNTRNVECELGAMNAGATVTVTVSVRGDITGTRNLDAEIAGFNRDPVTTNDTARATLAVNPVPPPPPKKSGGGGSLDWLLAGLLGLLLASRGWTRVSARR